MAAAGAACGVAAAWELVILVEGAAPRRLIAPLLAAGRSGPSIAERRRLAVVAAASVFAAGWIVMGPVPAFALAAGAPAGVGRAIGWRRARWRRELAAGAGVAARALADALAGGHSVRGAIGEAGSGLPGAAGEELRTAAGGLGLGGRNHKGLGELRARARGASWGAVVGGICLQGRSRGGLGRAVRDVGRTGG